MKLYLDQMLHADLVEHHCRIGQIGSRTPFPLESSFQFGDNGTNPLQYGQVIVRAQR